MKYSREKASKVMRVVSILGVICLLALQWVWWRNAYRAVEMDFMSKAEGCVSAAFEKAIMYQVDSTSKGIRVINESAGEVVPKGVKILPTKHKANNTKELLYVMEESFYLAKKPITGKLIDKQITMCLNEGFGYIPDHTLKIVRQHLELDSMEVMRYNRLAIGISKDTVYKQFGFNSYAIVVFKSPIIEFLKKGAFILIVSILLVLLIGWILVFQFMNMQRERKFSDFIIDYTRMITHDLKSPTSGLQMIFNWMRKDLGDQPEKQTKYIIDGLSLSNKIMLNLDNILYTAVSEQRELKVRLNDTPIMEFMERIVDSYRIRSYAPKNIVYKTHYEPENFRCSMDMSMMENVMHNLIDNAIKFTPVETLIEIFCSKTENEVVIRVKDNGMGIPMEEQKRIFDLFEQGYTNQSSQFPGFGIGLHFVELALRAHDGKVSVQSEVGKGTEFTLRFTSKEYS